MREPKQVSRPEVIGSGREVPIDGLAVEHLDRLPRRQPQHVPQVVGLAIGQRHVTFAYGFDMHPSCHTGIMAPQGPLSNCATPGPAMTSESTEIVAISCLTTIVRLR